MNRYRLWRRAAASVLLVVIATGVAFASWTPTKTWADRDVLTAADLNTYVSDNTDLLKTSINDDGTIDPLDTGYYDYAIKAADTTVTTSTTPVTVGLNWQMGANEKWKFEYHLKGTSNGTADFRFTLDCPGTPDALWVGVIGPDPNSASDPVTGAVTAEGTAFFIHGTGSEQSYIVHGWIDNGATAGNVTLNFAQRTSSGSTIIRGNSFVDARRLE